MRYLQQQLDLDDLGDTTSETESLIQDHEAKRRSLDEISQPTIKRGRDLVRWIERYEPRPPSGQRQSDTPSSMVTEEKIYVRSVLDKLMRKDEQLLRMWRRRMSELRQSRDLREFEIGFYKVIMSKFVLVLGLKHLKTKRATITSRQFLNIFSHLLL